MRIINLEDKKQWLEWRRHGLGASDIPAICGVCPYKSALDIYNTKFDTEEQEDNFWMARGRENEPEARAMFEQVKGREYPPLNIEHDQLPHFRASLDGYCEQTRYVLEIKNPGRRTLDLASIGKVPLNYQYQIQWQLFVSGAPKAFYFCYDADTMENHTIELYPDQAIWDKMIPSAHAFWGCVLSQTPPIDKKTTKGVCKTSSNILDEMWNIKGQMKALESEFKNLQIQLLELEGAEFSLENDHVLLYKSERSSIDYKKAAEDSGLDLAKYEKPKTISWTIKERK